MKRSLHRLGQAFLIGAVFGLALLAQRADSTIVDLKPENADLWEHRLGPETAVHVTAEESEALRPGLVSVEFSIVVSANGTVESAQLTGNRKMHADEAHAIEMERRFKPWIVNGAPAAVRLTDYVSLLPPEEWAASHVPFPEPWHLQGTVVQLSRTRCLGTCPGYELSIAGDGMVRFSGHAGVRISGDHVAHIDPSAVRGLIAAFQKADFFSAKDAYHAPWTDASTQTLTLTVNGRTKRVVDYLGTEAGLPLAIANLEAEVDEVAGSARWVKGDESTMASLEAEKWPFAAAMQQNLMLYDEAIASQNQPLIERFFRTHAPVLTPAGVVDDDKTNPQRIVSPVCAASASGDLQLVERLQDSRRGRGKGDKPAVLPQSVLNECLLLGARSGSVEVAAYWLDHGADVKGTGSENVTGSDMLANAIESGNAEMVGLLLEHGAGAYGWVGEEPLLTYAVQRAGKETASIVSLLIEAGADVNVHNTLGQTPIFAAGFAPDAVKPLLAAGADINARDSNGATPLINAAFIDEMVRELLADGADPKVSTKDGDTALKRARQFACESCAAHIEEALKKPMHGTASVSSVQ